MEITRAPAARNELRGAHKSPFLASQGWQSSRANVSPNDLLPPMSNLHLMLSARSETGICARRLTGKPAACILRPQGSREL